MKRDWLYLINPSSYAIDEFLIFYLMNFTINYLINWVLNFNKFEFFYIIIKIKFDTYN